MANIFAASGFFTQPVWAWGALKMFFCCFWLCCTANMVLGSTWQICLLCTQSEKWSNMVLDHISQIWSCRAPGKGFLLFVTWSHCQYEVLEGHMVIFLAACNFATTLIWVARGACRHLFRCFWFCRTANKGFWGALGMGDFFYELGVQLTQVSVRLRYDVYSRSLCWEVLQQAIVERSNIWTKMQEYASQDNSSRVKNHGADAWSAVPNSDSSK